jgi:PAS domain S-box-containing protein
MISNSAVASKYSVRVLHVDDDETFLKVSKEIFDLNGAFEIDFALNIEEALTKLQTQQYDVVLCDYELPPKNGLELLKELRSQKNEVPFIIFTGKGRDEVAIKALNLGADGYYDKNGSPETVYGELIHGINEVMEKKHSDARFRAIYDNNFDAVILMHPDGQIFSANPTSTRMFGWSEEELKKIGRNGLLVMDERTKAAIKERETKGQAKAELTFNCKDGSTIEGELISTLFRETNGALSVSMIIRDITVRKKVEWELRESSRKISAMNEKLRVVGGLTRHDVKNKLSVIRANAYLLKKRLSAEPELVKLIVDIDSAVGAADKLLEFSRLYEKIGAEQLSMIHIEDCFDEAVALLPALSSLTVLNECKGLSVRADSLLRQLFYNLLDNTLKHSQKATQIRVHFTKSDDSVKLIYEDNGIGIPEENKPKLFTEGFTTGNGSGLGLRLVKKMVEVYGWTIKETGVPGQGARFEILITR